MVDQAIVGAFLYIVVGAPVLFVLSGLGGLAIFVMMVFLNKQLLRFKEIVQPNNERQE